MVSHFMKINKWFLLGIIATACLYPLQKYIITDHQVKKELLKLEHLEVSSTYAVNEPVETFLLASRLAEISGLSLGQDDSTLLAVQDEEGILFTLDRSNGKVIDELHFGGDEDYEGVEFVGDKTYILTSKGDLRIINRDGETKAKKIKTELKRDDDVEGLGHLSEKNMLLLACKSNRAGRKKNRNVYGFSLSEQVLDTTPYLSLDPDIIAQKLNREKKTPYFSPSAIAVHPTSGEIFVLSSVARSIIVFDKQGNLIAAANLDRGVHLQPEGLALDRDGTMYIANEARGGVAKIYVIGAG
ncbi:MAG: hypothetical protein HKN87_14035 [Saprospiraceae bacterium]|nr:hypothetical protein [Saprospiraceae bacterium]